MGPLVGIALSTPPSARDVEWDGPVEHLLGFALGFGLLWLFLRNYWRATRARRWPIAPGRVLESSSAAALDGWVSFELTYEYVIDGVVRRGHRHRFTSSTYARGRVVDGFVARYPRGAAVDVRYDPNNPDLSVLESHFEWLSWLPVLAFALLILVPWTYLSVRLLSRP